ncbi:MAG: AMP-binding protein [Myxococcota bacterium]
MSGSSPAGWRVHLPEGVAYDPSAGGAGTTVAVWQRHADQSPDRVCLVDEAGSRLTWSDFEEASRRAAERLRATGVAVGDRVLFSAASSIEGILAHAACLRLGAVALPANTAYRAVELAHVVGDARPSAAIVDDPDREKWIRQASPEIEILSPAIETQDANVSPMELDRARPTDPALIGYTSGTTGRPKGAVLSHANLLASVEALRLASRWSPEDRLVLCLPLFHMHGLGVGLHGTLHAGASAVVLSRFDPDAVFDAISEHEATLFFGVPTLYHRLVDHPRVGDLSRLRLCVCGSAPLPAELHRRFEKVTGKRILERYGMTETAMLTSNPVEGDRRAGTVGRPLPGVEVRLAGSPGEIQVRGPNVFSGYWEKPAANIEAFTEDGFFRTGDLGHFDEAGYVCISGRAKELIISGGYNVYPREVEEALRQHPDIEDAAVVGTPSAEWGETVTAYLVGSTGVTVEKLREFLDESLAAYKHPRIVHHLDSLPHNALGKVQKHRLAEGRIVPEPSG